MVNKISNKLEGRLRERESEDQVSVRIIVKPGSEIEPLTAYLADQGMTFEEEPVLNLVFVDNLTREQIRGLAEQPYVGGIVGY